MFSSALSVLYSTDPVQHLRFFPGTTPAHGLEALHGPGRRVLGRGLVSAVLIQFVAWRDWCRSGIGAGGDRPLH